MAIVVPRTKKLDRLGRDARARDGLEDGCGRVARRRRHLDRARAPVSVVDEDEIGERAARVDADAERLHRGGGAHAALTSSSTSRIVDAISAMSLSSTTKGGEMCRFGPVIRRASTPRSVIGAHTRWAVA